MDDSSEKINIKELSNTIFIDIYEIINDELYILGNIKTENINENVKVKINSREIKVNELYFPQKDYLKKDNIFYHSFEFKFPLSEDKTYTIEFENENAEKLNIDFTEHCNFSKIIGYSKTKKFISIIDNNAIKIKKKTPSNWIKQETKAILNILKKTNKQSIVVIPFRIAYMLGYPFLKNKKIWFYMDRPKIADDNGMHLFKYAVKHDPEIKKYFIISKDSPDYQEMKKIGKVLPFQSLKHRYLSLFVENIVTSHPENPVIYPFWKSFPYYAGLLKSRTQFLQHGIIKDDISYWINKSEMNLSLFLTSAPKEYESLFQNYYNYDKDVVKLLGMPRFDNLKNEQNKKQILIMPSWRKFLKNKSDEEIIQSKFFKIFNSLLSNEKLSEIAKENDYEIIFRPHPHIYEFIELFEINDSIKVEPRETKYQTLFNNSSLLITDYSSVAFDFSYLKKPVIYYQCSNDYHYDAENGYFNYETMGFGEVCREEGDLIELLIEYIENDCKMKDKFIKRVDDFFLYTDKNNCKRVHEAIKNIPVID